LQKTKIQDLQKDEEFTYVYNGIEFKGNKKLSEDELEDLYQTIINQSAEPVELDTAQSSEMVTMGVDPGSSYVPVIPPIYKTYSNAGTQLAAELITAALVAKAPKPVQTSVFGVWVLNKLTGWADDIKPSYVGAWTSSTYDNYTQQRRYYETLVHYQNSDYTSPISVQYYDVTTWWV
jgi:hypothetical protein